MHDVTDLNVKDILGREFKKCTRVAGNIFHLSKWSLIEHMILKSI